MFTKLTFVRKDKRNLSMFSTPHQIVGGEAAKDMGAVTDSDYQKVVREYKLHPDAARRAFTFVQDARNVRSKIGLFLWKVNQITKDH